MYTMVLMAALTTGIDMPDRGGRRGGGCCGCYGGMGYGGCYGGMGMGYGGCYGGMGRGYGGCYGGMGMGYGGGYGGCYGGMGYGGGVILQGGTTQQGGGERIQKKPSERRDESLAPAPATILVQLPAEAKLLIDNEATTSTGSSRVFQSPALNPGKEYHYTLTAEIVRNGKPVKAEQVVTVRAGQTTPVTLTLPALGVAQR